MIISQTVIAMTNKQTPTHPERDTTEKQYHLYAIAERMVNKKCIKFKKQNKKMKK